MIKYMLSILMDGIKDAGMYMDYAEKAKHEDDAEYMTWFKNHAKMRIDELARDYDYISNQIGLVEKVREGDEIAEALMSHLTYQMSEMTKRFNAL